ncbi:MAG: C25 family cysteine peptidase [Bacteroidetes bacterium]|nr:C25 family cysteine peptidase [Bacteroidota bacterium]MCL2303675.1 C25 family cysteine peptidase [Lentimicrobiaceae bacterium]
MMKKLSMFLVAVVLVFAVNAQSIVLRTANTGISKSNDRFTGFQATFSYDQIESVTITETERGTFSAITIKGTYIDGEFGTPGLPVFKKMISVPIGATPKVVVKSHSTNEYSLEEYGIHPIFPRQPDVRKDWDMSTIPFAFDEKFYANVDYNDANIADVVVIGQMRGINIGMLVVRPVQYNPNTNTIKVFNDIEVEVIFENGDAKKTYDLFKNTFSPYFSNTYKKMFNTGVNRNVYDNNPDLFSTPVHMLVISHRMFETTLQPWIEWKTKKGFYMDVNYTDEIGTTNTAIRAFCHDKYNQGTSNGTAPTYIVIVGDVQQVPTFQSINSNVNFVSDHQYANVTSGYFPDMYVSRMSAQTTQQLQNIIEKTLYYEQYQFADPTYLDNVLLIAGADGTWNPRVGQQQINYANTHYYNAANGYANIYKYITSPYTNCYTHLNNVGFANFTAHCDKTLWSDPTLTIANVNALTNVNRYFVAMGNCCMSSDFNHNECIGEAMVRTPQKAAVAYIGSAPNTYWYDDFHFSVGAYLGPMGGVTNPTLDNTMDGLYDMMFWDADFNCLNSHIFGGNISVTYAHVNGLPVHTGGATGGPWYYWQAYNILGDGSLMPYNGQASENNVSHLPVIYIGLDSYEVMADPGSYVAISKDGILLGVAVANASGVALVPHTPITSGGDVDIVVTRNQRQPYIVQVPAVAQEGPYVVFGGYEVVGAEVLTYISTNREIEVTLKNVGIATSGALNVTITCDDPQLTITQATAQCPPIAPNGTAIVTFKVTVANDIPDNKTFLVDVTAAEAKATWVSKMPLKAFAPNFSLEKVLINGAENGNLEPGVVTITTVILNKGGADAYNVASDIEINSEYLTLACPELSTPIQPLPAGENMEVTFTLVADPSMSYGYEANLNLLLTAQYGRSFTAPFKVAYSGSDAYCVPEKTDCNHSSPDKFTLVKLYKVSTPEVTLINHNPTCGTEGYTDYTNIVVPLEPGAQYKLDVSVSTGTQHIKGWFDLNGNNIFESNELLFSGSCSSGTPTSFTFTIPQDFAPGNQRFRLRCKFNSTMADACEGYSYGQTLDYTIVLPELYPRVQNVNAELEGNNITVTWEAPEEGTPTGYNIYRNGNLLNTALLTVTNFTENNVLEGIYVYNVTAVYEANKESYAQMSNVICNFTPPILCETPVNPSGTADECIAVITWEIPENIDGVLLGYNVYRDNVKIGETFPSTLEYRDAVPANGTYVYQVSAVYGHCEESEKADEVTVVIDCVNIKEVQTDAFQIFPNPANNSVTIKGDGLIRVELFDLQGRKLAEYNNLKDQLQINDLSKFESGVYFVKMYSENHQMATKRLVIMK